MRSVRHSNIVHFYGAGYDAEGVRVWGCVGRLLHLASFCSLAQVLRLPLHLSANLALTHFSLRENRTHFL